MFVTREERQPLGGFISFVLPMMAFGMLAVIALRYAVPVAGVLALSLLYLWRPIRPVSTLISAVVVAVMVAAQGWLTDGQLAQLPGGAGFLSWVVLLVLAGAVSDDPDAALELPPPWRAVFPRLISLPLMIMITAFGAGLFALMIAALFQATVALAPDAAGGVRVFNELTGLAGVISTVLFGLFLGGAVSLVRYQRALIGAVRYAVLLAARYLLPFVCVIAAALFFSALGNPNYAVQTRAVAYLIMAGIVLVTVLLVYADGESRQPPFWVTLSIWCAVIMTSVLVGAQIIGGIWSNASYLASLLIVSLGSLFVFISAVADIFLRTEKWLSLLAPLNTALLGLIGFLPLILWGLMKVAGP